MQQNPFNQLNQMEQRVNSVQQGVANPGARIQNEANFVQRTINRGTANMVSALCYPVPFLALIAHFKKDWQQDLQVHFHSTHALVMWIAIAVFFCSVIGVPVAGLIWLAGLYMASIAVNGGQQRIPFLTQFMYSRHWL